MAMQNFHAFHHQTQVHVRCMVFQSCWFWTMQVCFQSKMQEGFKKEWHTYHATSALYCLAWARREICAHIEEFKEESFEQKTFYRNSPDSCIVTGQTHTCYWNVTCSDVDGRKVRQHLDFMRLNASLVPDPVFRPPFYSLPPRVWRRLHPQTVAQS